MKTIILSITVFLIFSCNSSKQDKIITVAKDTVAVKENTTIPVIQAAFSDSIFSGEQISDSMAGILAPAKENFTRINSVKEWTKIDSVELSESAEGGLLIYYYLYNRPQKIVRKDYGETYQELTEYYLLGKELSFVYEKTMRYNRPMYYDSSAMKEGNDSEAFDINRSTVQEIRSYFIKNKLIKQIETPDQKRAGKHSLEKEENRLQNQFKKAYRK